MEVYLVGGAVRDEQLGLPVKERDWCVVGATPDDLKILGYRPVGNEFPVFLHPESNEEYALARTERKTGTGYHGFTFHTSPDVTIEEDLARRDLTINAMAVAPDGKLIDPCMALSSSGFMACEPSRRGGHPRKRACVVEQSVSTMSGRRSPPSRGQIRTPVSR